MLFRYRLLKHRRFKLFNIFPCPYFFFFFDRKSISGELHLLRKFLILNRLRNKRKVENKIRTSAHFHSAKLWSFLTHEWTP